MTKRNDRRPHDKCPRPLLSQRSAVIILFALHAGMATATLAAFAGMTLAGAVLLGLLTVGPALTFFNKIIE